MEGLLVYLQQSLSDSEYHNCTAQIMYKARTDDLYMKYDAQQRGSVSELASLPDNQTVKRKLNPADNKRCNNSLLEDQTIRTHGMPWSGNLMCIQINTASY